MSTTLSIFEDRDFFIFLISFIRDTEVISANISVPNTSEIPRLIE